MNLDHPRRQAKEAIRATVTEELWDRNRQFTQELDELIANHRLADHPARSALSSGQFGRNALARLHLEYRHAGVQIFTDALLQAQLLTAELEDRLGPTAKIPARFLLTLNTLDELGFQPGEGARGYYRGHPQLAHYPLFEQLLDQLGVGRGEREAYVPSTVADALHHNLRAAYDDLLTLTTFLTIAEKQVVLFSPPMRQAILALGMPVRGGYYDFHGTSDEVDWSGADDDHHDDLWFLIQQAATPDRYDEVLRRARYYLGLWAQFWDEQMQKPRAVS
jgi:hypothetical protein